MDSKTKFAQPTVLDHGCVPVRDELVKPLLMQIEKEKQLVQEQERFVAAYEALLETGVVVDDYFHKLYQSIRSVEVRPSESN